MDHGTSKINISNLKNLIETLENCSKVVRDFKNLTIWNIMKEDFKTTKLYKYRKNIFIVVLIISVILSISVYFSVYLHDLIVLRILQ
jgi:hypothetical protein